MSRVQLALRVGDLDAAVEFYAKLFDTAPAKRRPGYANFAIVEPPLKGDVRPELEGEHDLALSAVGGDGSCCTVATDGTASCC